MSGKSPAPLPMVLIVALLAATATAQTPPVTVSPSTLGFGNVAVGSSLVSKVTLTNNQGVFLQISSPTVAGSHDFAIAGTTCGPRVAPGRSCIYRIAFSPQTLGGETGTLSVNDSAGNSPQQVSLTGTGAPPSTVSPTSVNFGSQLITTTSPSKTITLTNNQSVAMTLDPPTITADFALAGGTCGSSLTAFAKCTYLVTFTPPGLGGFTGTLTLHPRVSNGPFIVPLSGSGGTTGIQSVTISPTSVTIPSGSQQQFTAIANLLNGHTIPITTIAHWTSSNNKVAWVNATGLASAVGGGTASITAALSITLGASAMLTSPTVLVSIAVTPQNNSLPLGNSQQFTATGSYNDGSKQDVTNAVTWASSITTIASIASGGLAVSVAQGKTVVSATLDTVGGSTVLTIAAPTLLSLKVTPANFSVPVGASQQFTAVGTYGDGSSGQLTSLATWQSSNLPVATIAPGGIATGVATGSTSISATMGAVSASAALTISPATLQSIAVAPVNSSIDVRNLQQFTATGTNTDGSTVDLTGLATWTSSDSSSAAITSAGLAKSFRTGWTTITAAWQGVSGSTVLGVTHPGTTLQSITVAPSTSSMTVGDSQQLLATANFSDGSSRDVTSSAIWYVNQVNARYPADPRFAQFAIPSPVLSGALIELGWNMVDMGPGAPGGQYQWSTFDSTYVTPYTSMGKKVDLAVWAQNYPGQPSTVPAYVQGFGTNVVPGCSVFPNWIAPPYSPDFLTAYKSFLAEVVQHYANNPSIGYIRVGMSSGGEVHRYCTTILDTYPSPPLYSNAPFNCSTASNIGQCVWLAYDQDILNSVQSQSPAVQIIGPSTSQNQVDADPTNIYPSTEDDQAVADGFAFGNQGLQISDLSNYAAGLQCNANWCAKFDQYAGQVPLELQTAQQSDPTCTGVESSCTGGTGSLIDLLPFAGARHTTIFEIYEGDLYVGLDPSNPNYAAYGAQYDSTLQNALQSNPLASVNSSGMVTASAPGSTTVYAQYGAISGSGALTINPAAALPVKKGKSREPASRKVR